MPANPASNHKPVLAVDFDDVVILTVERLVEVYNRENNGKIKLENVYVESELGNSDFGWQHNREGAIEWVKSYLARRDVLETKPTEGAPDALRKLSKVYEIAIVTSRPEAIDKLIKHWLDTNIPGLTQSIHHTNWESKSKVCQGIGASILIEDNPVYVHECHKAGIKVIVFGDYPWNQNDRLPVGTPRARSWAEVEEILL